MSGGQSTLRYVSRRAALLILAATAATVLICILIAINYNAAPPAKTPNQGDLGTNALIVQQMRDGSGYYQAAHTWLVARHYGTHSVFNWRTPLYPWILSRFPSLQWPQRLLGITAVAVCLLAYRMVRNTASAKFALMASACLAVGLIPCFVPPTILFSELTAGALIALSVCAYGLNRWRVGCAAGLAALMVRELAAPYVLICIALAWRERRLREITAWIVGLGVYFVYYSYHYHCVQMHVRPDDPVYASGWVQFGGLGFVLSTAAMNGTVLLGPLWATAIFLPVSLLGLFAWPDPRAARARLTTGAYLLIFSIVGKPFNGYWGLLYTPLLSLGLPWLPLALRDLVQAVSAPTAPPFLPRANASAHPDRTFDCRMSD